MSAEPRLGPRHPYPITVGLLHELGYRPAADPPEGRAAQRASKEEVIAGVRRLGFDPADDNEADALALLDWALKTGGRQ